ncbi:MAG: hypothetical protein ACLVBP_09855 [Ruminococcus sp.]
MDCKFLVPAPNQRSLIVERTMIHFLKFCEAGLSPIFDVFPNLAIHESVYRELVADMVRDYVDSRQKEKTTSSACLYGCGIE